VLINSRRCGMAAVLTSRGMSGENPIRDVGKLHEKSANELARWIRSDNLLEASIGMAAINSLLSVDESKLVQVNGSEIIAQRGKDKNISMIGHFPFVERVAKAAKNFWVIEKRPIGNDLPEDAAAEYLPQSDVVVITGTTFTNHTIVNLLPLCKPDALVMILGPSTPMSPVLFDYGVKMLAGTIVDDEEAAILTIEQGAVFQQVKGVRLVNMAVEQIQG
jgi:uncharacterized protein (DUF4213/DUF364 family)